MCFESFNKDSFFVIFNANYINFIKMTANLTNGSKLYLLLITLLIATSCNKFDTSKGVQSPNKKIAINIKEEGGNIIYNVLLNNTIALNNSKLGLVLSNLDLASSLKIDSISRTDTVYASYNLRYGKKKSIEYLAHKRTYYCSNNTGNRLDIIFQVSDNGVAFHYIIPGKTDTINKIDKENTSFNLPENTVSWIQPITDARSGWCNDQPSYEENYYREITVENLTDTVPGWIYPALFKTAKAWLLISETAPNRNYCGSRLLNKKGSTELQIGFPQKDENKDNGPVNPQSVLPWKTPWRIIALSEDLSGIVESNLCTDLSRPEIQGNFDYIKPGRASWSWPIYKDDSTIYDVQKKFIDYASEMGWEYCLVDAAWDTKIGKDKIEMLAKYASSKNVGLLLWYNSSGDWNTVVYTPKSQLLTHEAREKEFEWLYKIGIKGIKVDFFGGDGQSMMDYYQDILEDAAKYKLVVNYHGCTLPRGLQRTYPNLVNMEAVRGFEFVTFDQVNADMESVHCCLLPYTRNVFDPMDFTPVCFSEIPNIKRKTSSAFELALAFIFNGGIQHFAEVPTGMAGVPDYVKQLMKEVTTSWDDTKFLAGYPGKYVVLARNKGNTWYIAGISADSSSTNLTLKVPFAKENLAKLVSDGNSDRTFSMKEISIANNTVSITIAPNSGFVIKL